MVAKADPKDYDFQLPDVGNGHAILRVINLKTNSKVKVASFNNSNLQVAAERVAGTMSMPALPVFDPRTGDYIYKIEPGMVLLQLDTVVTINGEPNPIPVTLKHPQGGSK